MHMYFPQQPDAPVRDPTTGDEQGVDDELIEQRVAQILSDLERPDGIDVPEALARLTECLGDQHIGIAIRLVDSAVRDPSGEVAPNAKANRKNAMADWVKLRRKQSPGLSEGDGDETSGGEKDMDLESDPELPTTESGGGDATLQEDSLVGQ